MRLRRDSKARRRAHVLAAAFAVLALLLQSLAPVAILPPRGQAVHFAHNHHGHEEGERSGKTRHDAPRRQRRPRERAASVLPSSLAGGACRNLSRWGADTSRNRGRRPTRAAGRNQRGNVDCIGMNKGWVGPGSLGAGGGGAPSPGFGRAARIVSARIASATAAVSAASCGTAWRK